MSRCIFYISLLRKWQIALRKTQLFGVFENGLTVCFVGAVWKESISACVPAEMEEQICSKRKQHVDK